MTKAAAVLVLEARLLALSSSHGGRTLGSSGAFVPQLTHLGSCRSFYKSTEGTSPSPAALALHRHQLLLHQHPPPLSLLLPLPLLSRVQGNASAPAAALTSSSRQKSHHRCAGVPYNSVSLSSTTTTTTTAADFWTRTPVRFQTNTVTRPSGLIASSAFPCQRRLYSTSTSRLATMAEQQWPGAHVRKTFLEFFEKRGHTIGTISPLSHHQHHNSASRAQPSSLI